MTHELFLVILYFPSVFDVTFMLFVDRDRGSDWGREILHDTFSVPVD